MWQHSHRIDPVDVWNWINIEKLEILDKRVRFSRTETRIFEIDFAPKFIGVKAASEADMKIDGAD